MPARDPRTRDPQRPDDADDARAYTAEDVEDAGIDGDRTFEPGTARAALSHRAFRRVYIGSVASNMGTWMQNVVLTAFVYDLTGDETTVGLMNFATLGPLLLLSLPAGSLADRFDRRKLLIISSVVQAVFAFTLAAIARDPNPTLAALIVVVFAMNAGQALAAPTFSAVLPSLVPRRDIPGAVSLTSANMNLSRVVGAALGPAVYAAFGVSWVFFVNALTYFFIIAGVWNVETPRVEPDPNQPRGLRRLLEGFTVIRRDPVLTRVMVTCAVFSFFSLVFIAWMSPIAGQNLGIAPKSFAYGALYSCFGLGAGFGALSLGTFLVGKDLNRLVRIGFVSFAFALTAFALWRIPGPAYPTAFVVGFCYFMAFTSLSTVLQQRLADRDRGKVMAIWIMAFGGMVSIGALALGPVARATSLSAVIIFGALVAVGLAFYARLGDPIAEPDPDAELAPSASLS